MNQLERSQESNRTDKQEARPARQAEALTFLPLVDVYENAEEVLLIADIPGAKADSVDVRLEPPRLILTASQPPSSLPVGATPLRFERTFRVPEGIDPDRMEAKVERGVLSIHLRKSDRTKPKRIVVRGD